MHLEEIFVATILFGVIFGLWCKAMRRVIPRDCGDEIWRFVAGTFGLVGVSWGLWGWESGPCLEVTIWWQFAIKGTSLPVGKQICRHVIMSVANVDAAASCALLLFWYPSIICAIQSSLLSRVPVPPLPTARKKRRLPAEMELPNGVPLDVAQAQLVKFSPAQEAARKVFEQMYGPVQGGANPAALQTPLPDQASSHSGPGDMDGLVVEGEGAESGVRGRSAGNEGEISMKSAAEQLAVSCAAVYFPGQDGS